MTCAVEDLSHENQVLRQQAGVSATHTVDLSGIKLAKVKPVNTHDVDPAIGTSVQSLKMYCADFCLQLKLSIITECDP
jgi:hypothetical protein